MARWAVAVRAWHVANDDGLPGDRQLIGGCFNGKIERPRLVNRALDRGALLALTGDTVPSGLARGSLLRLGSARYRTADHPTTPKPSGRHHDQPAGARMTGQNWDGTEMNWRHAPHQYGAIHFHDDDMIDARWETDFSFTVPNDQRSGCYAAMLQAGGAHSRSRSSDAHSKDAQRRTSSISRRAPPTLCIATTSDVSGR